MTWDSKRPVFLHDVDKGVDSVCLLTQQSRIDDVQILFVVERGKSFITVKPLLIRLGDGPYPKSIGISSNSVSRNRMPLKTMVVASMAFLRSSRASYGGVMGRIGGYPYAMDTICVSRRRLSKTWKTMNKRSCCYKKAQTNPLV